MDNIICDENLNIRQELLGKTPEIDQDKILKYLATGVLWVAAASLKPCEVCGEIAGPRSYLIDGDWLWPKFVIHYIEFHQLQLPNSILNHIRNLNYEVPTDKAKMVFELPAAEMIFI